MVRLPASKSPCNSSNVPVERGRRESKSAASAFRVQSAGSGNNALRASARECSFRRCSASAGRHARDVRKGRSLRQTPSTMKLEMDASAAKGFYDLGSANLSLARGGVYVGEPWRSERAVPALTPTPNPARRRSRAACSVRITASSISRPSTPGSPARGERSVLLLHSARVSLAASPGIRWIARLVDRRPHHAALAHLRRRCTRRHRHRPSWSRSTRKPSGPRLSQAVRVSPGRPRSAAC